MVKRKAINTCEDGTCRTLIAWYAKGGRSNFAAWNGKDRFLMTAVLEEYDDEDMKLVDRFIVDHQGYGKNNEKPGSHMVKTNKTADPMRTSGSDVCTTLTTFCGLNKLVVEVYDDEK